MILPNFKPSYVRYSNQINQEIITNTGSQSYTVSAGTTHLAVEMWGGGAGGGAGYYEAGDKGGSDTYASGGGGGSGAYTYLVLTESFVKNDTVNFTVGSGGAAEEETSGADGASTTLDTHKRATTTLTTYTSKSAGGGFGGGRFGGSGGGGGTSSGGISPSANGATGNNGQTDTFCVNGGKGGVPPMVAAQSDNGGICPSTVAANGSIAGMGGGGGLPAIFTKDAKAGNGANGRIRITAYSYSPPTPTT
jgi:hypothetical protein